MKVYFTQIYADVGVNFNISYKVTNELTDRVNKELIDENVFELKHGEGYKLGFVISAKKGIDDMVIKGPSTSGRYKTVEYVLYLPYEKVMESPDQLRTILHYVSKGVTSVLSAYNATSCGIDVLLSDLTREMSENLGSEVGEEKGKIDFDEIVNKARRDRKQ
jgi:hypothetical protein